MRAAYLTKQIDWSGLIVGDIPAATPGENDALVKVRATAVTPSEFRWFPTFKTAKGEARPFPLVLSHEFSGEVAALGRGVKGFAVGDAVIGLNDWFANGALAEYCVAPAAAIARKPKALSDEDMACTPISALTAWQGLFDKGDLQAGERVLIHGAAGGVGVFAVQLARWKGAYVVATASTKNLQFVRDLGADEVIDYKTQRFEDVAGKIDVLFDAVGGETLNRSWGLLKPDGRAVTVAADDEGAKDARAQKAFFIVEPNADQLAKVAAMMEAGEIRAFVETVFPLTQTQEAFARAARGGMRGKIAVIP